MDAVRPSYEELVERVGHLEGRLREQQVLSDALAEHARDIILVVRREDGRILQANAAAAIYGYSHEQLLGLTIRDLRAPESLGALAGQMSAGDAAGALFETVHQRRDGTRFPVEVSSVGLTIAGSRVLLGVVRDTSARQQVTKALRESEERYRTLTSELPVGVLIQGPNAEIVLSNPKALELLGLTEGQLLGKTSFDPEWSVVHEDGTPFPGPSHPVPRALATRQPVRDVVMGVYRPATRDRVWLLVNADPQLAADGSVREVVCTFADITSRRKSDEVLRLSDTALRTVSQGVVISTRDQRVVWANEAITAITGYTFADLENETMGLLRGPGTDPATARAIREALANGGEFAGEVLNYRKDGTPFLNELTISPVRDESGGLTHSVGVVRDITARDRSEQTLRRNERDLCEAERVAHVGHWTWDTRSNRVYWSDEMKRIWGLDPADVGADLAAVITQRVHPDDRARVAASNEAVLASQAPAPMEYRIVLPDRTVRTIHAVPGAARQDADGKIVELSGIVQDVTEARRAEADRLSLAAQLTQAQKMESVGRLAGGVAHDFNNMLAVIIGVAELAMLQLDPGHSLRADLEEINDAARRSAELTRQLLTFARKQTVLPTALDLNAAVARSNRMLERLIGENIRLEWRPADGLWEVYMDPSQVDQILANLSVNARDAIGDVGTLVIATSNRVIDQKFCATHADAVPGEYVRLTVSDTGQGMSSDVLAQVFEPFFTTKPVGEGTGLGLATVYGAVRQNNGFITVRSVLGQGTTFDLYLPRHRDEAAAERPSSPVAASSGGHETILVVEDEPRILRLTQRALERHGYVVLTANGPAEALAVATARGGDIDLLLTDLVMPGMNGRDLADALRSQHPRIERLFMSGFPAGVAGRSTPVDDPAHFLAKPFTVTALTTAVRAVLDQRAATWSGAPLAGPV